MTNFRLYDVLEGKDLIGNFETKQQVANACTSHADDCENECDFLLYQKVDDSNKLVLVPNWTYSKNTINIIK